ncbi:MAG: hypothetical protein K8T20_00880 [Planctomycetes bacterium]|nr:hypothetical protein [Planctomycetota bacterium]
MKLALQLILVAACAAVVFADKIVLKDGRTFEGEILEDAPDHVKIKTAKSALTFTREQIESVERGVSPLQERVKRMEALDGENAAAYLDLAVWMVDAPKEIQDEKTLRRACNIAAFLDPSCAAKAQLLLGNWLLAAGKRPDAAECYARVLKADEGNAEAKKQLGTLNAEIVETSKKSLVLLRAAVQPVRELHYGEAIPLLRKVTKVYFADKCKQYVKISIEDLADDLQKRVPCVTCKGSATRACAVCKGTGLTECVNCKGTGVRLDHPPNPTFAQEICTHCYHTGKLLCTGCDAERYLTVAFSGEVNGKNKVDIKIVAGVEKVALSEICSLSTWKSRKGDFKVTMITAGALVKGGTFTCKDCKGIKFDPPATEVNTFGITDYVNAIDALLSGKEKIEGVVIPETAYDAADIADKKFKWKGGKWEE